MAKVLMSDRALMDFTRDHFSLFELPRRFAVDMALLDSHYRKLQAEVHPDRHAHQDETTRRLAMQWATRVNEAYQVLKNPLKRAEYLLQLAGMDAHAERSVPADFLLRQLEWREAVADARQSSDEAALDDLQRRLKKELRAHYDHLGALLDAGELLQAAVQTRQLMFEEKLLVEINEAWAVLEG